MKHFDVEEIARFAEGNVNDSERERFISHLAECGACFKAYADTLKFVQDDRKNLHRLRLPGFEKIKITVRRLRQDIDSLFRNRNPFLVPAFALLVIMVFLAPFLVTSIQKSKITKAQIQHIAVAMENMDSQSFAPARDDMMAAVRTGILVEDLSLLVKSGGNSKTGKELQRKVLLLLENELSVFALKKNPITAHLNGLDKKNLDSAVKDIEELVESRSRGGLFQLGRFVEQSFLSTFKEKCPSRDQVEVYKQIARRNNLPQGIYNNLSRLKETTEFTECKQILMTIKDIIFS